MRVETLQIMAQLVESNTISSTVSRDAIELTNLLRTHHASYLDNIKALDERIIEASWGHIAAVATLAECHNSEEN